jgi:hypothetical protein
MAHTVSDVHASIGLDTVLPLTLLEHEDGPAKSDLVTMPQPRAVEVMTV